jgi:hypothetical protein
MSLRVFSTASPDPCHARSGDGVAPHSQWLPAGLRGVTSSGAGRADRPLRWPSDLRERIARAGAISQMPASHRGYLGQVANQPYPSRQPTGPRRHTRPRTPPSPAIRAVTIVATASEQQNQHEDNQNCTLATPYGPVVHDLNPFAFGSAGGSR